MVKILEAKMIYSNQSADKQLNKVKLILNFALNFFQGEKNNG